MVSMVLSTVPGFSARYEVGDTEIYNLVPFPGVGHGGDHDINGTPCWIMGCGWRPSTA